MNLLSNHPVLPANEGIRHEIFVIVYPPAQQYQNQSHNFDEKLPFTINLNQLGIKEAKELDTRIPITEQLFDEQSCQEKNLIDEEYIESEVSTKKRMNKQEVLESIGHCHIDNGRGGNCVASNICKTFLRIMLVYLDQNLSSELNHYMKTYQIRSQKQNSVIIMLLLFVFTKQGKLLSDVYQKIFQEFQKTLTESEKNCENKMKQQQNRRGFHLKNRRMYRLFAQITSQIFNRSKQNLESDKVWQLKELEQKISNSYDRKQRQVEKASNKIKSIILNHNELKQFFDYYQVDILMVFFEALDFVYRRNLHKKCKKVRQKAQSIVQKFKTQNIIDSQQNTYLMLYATTKLLGQKEKEIWSEFVKNLYLKKEFNENQLNKQKFRHHVEKEIPQRFRQIFVRSQEKLNKNDKSNLQIKEKQIQQMENICKISEEPNEQSQIQKFIQTYQGLRQWLEF